jgi:hypothetical protein
MRPIALAAVLAVSPAPRQQQQNKLTAMRKALRTRGIGSPN